MITLLSSPPFCTVQDLGRPGYRAEGVPLSGAMDPWSLQAANLLVGNEPAAAGLEWALGGGSLRFERAARFALAGAGIEAALNGQPVPPATSLQAEAGDVLRLGRLHRGRFAYLAVAGGIAVEPVLGSRSTYLPGGFGGFGGRRLKQGDVLPLGPAPVHGPPVGTSWPAAPDGEQEAIRVVAGPQFDLFPPAVRAGFEAAPYRITPAGDRTGYRLEGTPLPPLTQAELPSEAACVGAIQVPDSGLPIVLLADAPTVGGYPKIGVVIAADLPSLVQRRPGETVRFRFVDVAEAVAALRQRAEWVPRVMPPAGKG